MHRVARRLVLAVLLFPSLAAAADVLVPGKLLRFFETDNDAAKRVFVFRAGPEPVLAPPFGDPTTGASLLLFSSNTPEGCRVDVALPAVHWTPLGNDPAKGWRYVDQTGSVAGIKRIVLKATASGGKIVVKAKGASFPCSLPGGQGVPFEVTLRMGGDRYCASFGLASVLQAGMDKLKAKNSPAPLLCAGDDVRVATLNVLHGLFCPAPTSNCRLADRIALLGQWIVDRKCPDVIALQEVSSNAPGSDVLTQINAQLLDVCPDPYYLTFQQTFVFDDTVILSRHGAMGVGVQPFYGLGRHALHARIDHPLGPIDVFSTHLASGSDFATNPCGAPPFGACPAECVLAGAATVRECQAVQLAAFVTAEHDVDEPAFVVGDFNASAGSFVYDQMTTGLGAVDTFLAAGNAECNAGTGIGCTSGRIDDDLTDLEATPLAVDGRIDFVFMIPPSGASTCSGVLDVPGDADGDGVGTRLFAAEPNPFAACGAAPAPMCWVSDHSGGEADLGCD
jgi:endonuclease/exonuclease/phosphatase family metal-dependent hydrolase